MSYDERDAAMDDFYERLRRELYPEHREQAIEEFTAERLRSYYAGHPKVMRPAVEAVHEARSLLMIGKHDASLVFSASAFELLLKATLLQPILHGLVHHETLASLLVEKVVGRQTDIERYQGLLSSLFHELAEIDLAKVSRAGGQESLMKEAKQLQTIRDQILHRGSHCSREDAERALDVAVAMYDNIVVPMLGALVFRCSRTASSLFESSRIHSSGEFPSCNSG